MESAGHAPPSSVTAARKTLMVLCGPAASGKSSFAAQRFAASVTVASDDCRELICDDSNNQRVNRDAFDLFYYIINKRLSLSRFTVADSTALRSDARRRLLGIARGHGYATCLLIFDTPLATCLARNRGRARVVEEQVLIHQAELLRQSLRDAPREGWDQLYILQEEHASGLQVKVNT
jgi:predicted kinase